MGLNWLQSLLFGLISGLSEFLPVSAEAHRGILLLLNGAQRSELLELAVRSSAFLALLLSCWPQILKLQRERRIAAVPPRRRKRQPDQRSLKDLRFLKTAVIPVLLAFTAWPFTQKAEDSLWQTALLLAVNGVLLYLPPYFPGGNKDSQTVSGLDGILSGLGGALGVIPGISRISGITAVGQLRGCDRRYILDVGLLLCIPAMLVMCLFDLVAFFAAGAVITGGLILTCVLAAITAFPAAYLGITFLRFLSVKVGFSGFAYYSWGAALFTFILYLTI